MTPLEEALLKLAISEQARGYDQDKFRNAIKKIVTALGKLTCEDCQEKIMTYLQTTRADTDPEQEIIDRLKRKFLPQ